MKILLTLILTCIIAGVVYTQIGPPYEITQAVIAGGGATSTDGGGQYSVTGTIAQPRAGVLSSNGPFGFRAGFWQAFFAPTAAMVSIEGRVVTSEGRPIGNVRLILTDGQGTIRAARTSLFGYFRFDEVEVGNSYIISATHRRFEFAPHVVTVNDAVVDLVIQPIGAK